MTLLAHEQIETGPNPSFSVIWLHGLGASGHDFVPLVPELNLPSGTSVRFIFPHAPERPVTVNGGYIMPSWYDIYAMDIDRKIDQEQILISCAQVHQFIERELAAGIPSDHIILAGFSQGGAVAYQAALSFAKPLGGLLAMSTYFATPELCNDYEAQKALPILIQHGKFDSVVAESLGQKARDRLAEMGFDPEYKVYSMDHELCQAQIVDISAWLSSHIQS